MGVGIGDFDDSTSIVLELSDKDTRDGAANVWGIGGMGVVCGDDGSVSDGGD